LFAISHHDFFEYLFSDDKIYIAVNVQYDNYTAFI